MSKNGNNLVEWKTAIRQIADNVDAQLAYEKHCVDCYPDLLEALKDCSVLLSILGFESSDEYQRTVATIAKAEVKS